MAVISMATTGTAVCRFKKAALMLRLRKTSQSSGGVARATATAASSCPTTTRRRQPMRRAMGVNTAPISGYGAIKMP